MSVRDLPLSIHRRAVLAGIAALALSRPALAASGTSVMAYKYPDPYELTSDDIAWFRQCRSLWVEAESGAPGIFAPELAPELMYELSEADYAAMERRLEPVLCAFLLHATFRPGRYALAAPGPGTVEVTETDITLLQHTSWRAFSVDPKRPYGDFTNYPIEMAQALGLPVTIGEEGYAVIDPALEAELVELHRKSESVLQAYIEHAELMPGRWLIPFDGWDAIISPRCRPVGPAAMAQYRADMAAIAERSRTETAFDLVVPLIRASATLFASP